MNRREFLKITAGTTLMLAGTAGGISRVFAHSAEQEKRLQSKLAASRHLGTLNVSPIGLGCLPMVGYYGGKYDKNEMISLIRRAFEKGVTFLTLRKSMALIPAKNGSAKLYILFGTKSKSPQSSALA